MPSIDNYYQGSDGAWTNANWSGGAVPTSNEVCVIPAAVTVNISGTDQSGVDLNYLEDGRGFKGNIGSSGDTLHIDADKLVHNGSGTLWLTSDGSGTNAGTTDWVIIDSDNMANAATLDGDEMTRISVKKGKVTLSATLGDGGAKPAAVDVAFRDNPANDAYVEIGCAIVAGGVLRQIGGRVVAKNDIPTMVIAGGICKMDNTNSGAATNIYVTETGTLLWQSDGTAATVNVMGGGTVDAWSSDRSVFMTAVNVFPGSTFIYNPDTFTGTINELGGKVVTQQVQRNQPFGPPVP